MSEDLQRKYFQLQLLKQQVNALMEEKGTFEEKLSEVLTTMNAINELEKINEGEEIWSPLGSGAFVRSDIKDKEKILINIGAGIIVKEGRKKASEVMETRLNKMSCTYNELIEELNKMGKNIEEAEKELQSLAEKMQK